MTDQVTQSDARLVAALTPANSDQTSSSGKWTDELLKTTTINANDSAAPSSGLDRFTLTTKEGLENAPMGLVHAGVSAVENWQDTAKMVATSAVVGTALKLALPETGIAGKVVGGVLGLGFAYEASKPIQEAYSEGMHAKTMGDINAAGQNLGDGIGGFVVNSAVAAGGYRIGAGFGGKLMSSQALDGYAAIKDKVWTLGKSADSAPALDVSAPTESHGFAARVKIDGDRATLLNTEKAAPKNATVKGDVDPNAPMDVTLYAQTKGTNLQMSRDIARIASGRQAPMTDGQITEKYGAVPESVAAIKKFADANGLKIEEHNPASGRTRLSGTTGAMEKAFAVKLQEYEHSSGITFRGRTGTISVDTELAPHVKAIVGLDNRPQFKTNLVKGDVIKPITAPTAGDPAAAAGPVGDAGPNAPKPAAGGPRALQVEEVMKAYGADPKYDGKGMTTGFLSLGGVVDDNFQGAMQARGIDPDTFQIRNTGSSAPTSDPGGANGENDLDAAVHKFALPKATTVMIQAENNDSGMPTGIDRGTFPVNGESQITHFSISWGMDEDGWTQQAMSLMEDAGKRAALKNITITVASGDNGAGDNSPSKKQQVDIPAGLEHFTGSGGTQLIVDGNGNYVSEKGWQGMGAGGGGRSLVTPRPLFQKLVDLMPNLNGSKFDGRGVPDISSNADPRSGVIVPTDQGDQAIGGTSAAAPQDAVKAAIISAATGKPTGYWNPELYNMGAKNPGVFHDVTSGNNTDAGIKGYPATKGYDLDTGWGSVNIAAYIDARNKMFNQSAFAKNLSQIPDFLKHNEAPTHALVVPYQAATTNDNSNK